MELILEGLVLGLATGGYCLTACLPFIVPYMLAEARPGIAGNLKLLIEFLSGRLLAYIIFAVVVSILGRTLQGVYFSKFLSVAMIITASFMLMYAWTKNFPASRFCTYVAASKYLARMPFLFGFLIGINICPPFLMGMIKLLELGNVFKGVVYFLAFFIGTSLYMLPLLSLAWTVKIKRLQNIGNLTAFLVGVWFLVAGILTLVR
ncbi:MAG: sulfite exporter TauE/SafE family protein [Candidatus Omnitrophica bacterium]|nr:sulfite exporter TauE/SafE family protein [Candidatus Omnitrophota bacterium]MDD5236523.1 sulfite exporter TauE/SafE family protein [Candidatus Omnitrophota bacterium]MDD5610241.1 sulfite exporter TauE/SafE family protein [Candidatus Omnitrophota bacterium]